MANEFDFGEAVLDIKTDRSQLTSGLKQAQIQTNNASAQMSKSLDKATGSTQATTASLLLLDKAAVASGSSSLAYTRVLVELTLATGGLNEITKATTASMVGLKTATLLSTVPMLAMGAAITVAVGLFAVLANVRRVAEWTTGLGKANDKLNEIKNNYVRVLKKEKEIVEQIQIRIAILKGDPLAGKGNIEERNELKRLARLTRFKQLQDDATAKRKAELEDRAKRISDLRTEMGLLTGQIKPVDLLKTLQEKILFTKNESLRLAKEESLEAKARAAFAEDAYRSRRKELGLVVRGKTSPLSELRSMVATRLGGQLQQAKMIAAIKHLRPELQDAARQMLGVSAGQGGGGIGGSPAALGGVRQALSAGGVAFGGVKKTEVNLLKSLDKKGVNVVTLLEALIAQEKGLGAFEEN